MDVRDIVELVNLVATTDISELEIEREGLRLRIVRAVPAPGPAAGTPSGSAVAQVLPPQVAVERVAEGVQSAPASLGAEEDDGLEAINAPVVGTFYRAPSPNAEPYISVGDRVKKGQVVCILEAMKLMNEIESEVSGLVVESLVEDGQPVEYGQPLFRVRPGG